MTVTLTSANDFVTKLRAAILQYTNKYDTAQDFLLQGIMQPNAAVLSDLQNNELRPVSQLLSLENATSFTSDDLASILFNEGILPPTGSPATTVLTFSRGKPFTSAESGAIARGFPVATVVSDSGALVVFVTTTAVDKTSAVATLDPITNQVSYQVSVSAVSIGSGSGASVGPNRITRPLQGLAGYDSVTNQNATQAGNDAYSNAELVDLYLLAISSRQLSVPAGNEFYVRDNFSNVSDVNEVFGVDPLLSRAASDAGAVDSFVLGTNVQTIPAESVTFLGYGQTMRVLETPLVSVASVTRASDSHVFVEGTDYSVIYDPSGYGGSVRGVDGIQFLPTLDLSYGGSALAIGEAMTISYSYSALVQELQLANSDPRVNVEGRDLLYRLGTGVNVYLSFKVKVNTGFIAGDVVNAVTAAIEAFLDPKAANVGLGGTLEFSDLDVLVRRFVSVGNFIVVNMTRDPTVVSTGDISFAGNEYPILQPSNLVVTAI